MNNRSPSRLFTIVMRTLGRILLLMPDYRPSLFLALLFERCTTKHLKTATLSAVRRSWLSLSYSVLFCCSCDLRILDGMTIAPEQFIAHQAGVDVWLHESTDHGMAKAGFSTAVGNNNIHHLYALFILSF